MCEVRMVSKAKGTLYTGVTSNLKKQVWKHRTWQPDSDKQIDKRREWKPPGVWYAALSNLRGRDGETICPPRKNCSYYLKLSSFKFLQLIQSHP